MSLSANELVRLIKNAARDAVEASNPFALKIGTVLSVSPLKISLNQKITVSASQLLLTNAVRDFSVTLTENDTDAVCTVHLGLTEGEKVLLLRCDGGQTFIVLDRLEAPNG